MSSLASSCPSPSSPPSILPFLPPVSSPISLSPRLLSLTALGALALWLLPHQFLPLLSPPSSPDQYWWWALMPEAIIPPEEQFCCGGGPFSFSAASLISVSCDRHLIHRCCEVHDVCYDQRNISRARCDDEFCDCLAWIRASPYCEHIAHPGLCLAAKTFGHLFHWTANCTATNGGGSVPEECHPVDEGSQHRDMHISRP